MVDFETRMAQEIMNDMMVVFEKYKLSGGQMMVILWKFLINAHVRHVRRVPEDKAQLIAAAGTMTNALIGEIMDAKHENADLR